MSSRALSKKGKEKVIKIAALNIGIAALDIIVFSDGLLHIDMSGSNILAATFGATIIVMSLLVFIVGNYKLLYVKEKIIQTDEIKTIEDYISALEQNYEKKTFVKDIDTILEQIKRFQKKKETINEILLQKFDSNEMTYSKFQGAISDGENLFNLNIKSILNKLNAFDEEDYDQIKKDDAQMKFSKEFIQTKIFLMKF